MKGDAMADGMCGGHVAKERLALFLQNNCLPKGHCGDCRAHGLRRPVSPRVRVCTLCVGVWPVVWVCAHRPPFCGLHGWFIFRCRTAVALCANASDANDSAAAITH